MSVVAITAHPLVALAVLLGVVAVLLCLSWWALASVGASQDRARDRARLYDLRLEAARRRRGRSEGER